MWEHFKEVPGIGENGKKKAKCNYCPQLIVISGTSGMWNHLGRCAKYNSGYTQGTQSRKRRKIVKKGQVVSSPSYSKFDQEACRAQLVRTFVCAELPFRFVENEEFRKLLIILQPRFDIPSRYTLRRDIWMLYNEELGKLKKVLKNCGRVCLTTDTWTSNQNLNYMSLIVHFVDRELKLHKKIINFCQITGHTGDMLGKYVDTYLRDWGLYGKILTVTVDNAKANDVMIRYLHNMMSYWDNHVLNGDYVHMRCCTHVLNLIVKEDKQGSISKIRHAVKWVKSSPSRLEKFMICASDEKIPYKGAVVLDVDIRWNSMYSMLTVALKYRKAFHKLSVREVTFRREMEEKTTHGITDGDWDYVESVLPLLELFYKSTIRLSGSLYVTSASYVAEVFAIGKGINKHMSSTNKYIMETANKMKIKFNKYWGDPDTLDILLLIAFVLDPQAKLHFAEFYIDLLYASIGKAKHLKDKLMSDFRKIYVQYGGTDYSQSSLLETRHEKDDDDIWCHYSQETGHE